MSDSNIGDLVACEAQSWAGTPYRHQASTKGVGCDCLGLIRGVWRALIGQEPEMLAPYTMDWAEAAEGDPLLEAARRHFRATSTLQTGTLILFRWKPALPAKHCGIYLENGRFIHAYERQCVMVSSLVPQWRRKIAGMFDFPIPQSGD